MADERTPLIQVVEIRPAVVQRYPHSRVRRFCTLVLSTVPVLVVAAVLLCIAVPTLFDGIFEGHKHRHHRESYLPLWSKPQIPSSWPQSEGLNFDDVKRILLETPNRRKAEEWSRYYTAGPHLAGKNLSQALWTMKKWEEFGVKSELVAYDVYLNYPIGHRLALLERQKSSEGKKDEEWDLIYEALLEENVLDSDPTSGLEERVPTFHGYSANGNVTAPYVFVNRGTYEDFDDLIKANVSLEGKIALAKYGRIFRGLKVKRAQELGMIGIVMYSDPGDDGAVDEHNNHTYPYGPAREPSSVQRGSCQFLSTNFQVNFSIQS
jgi:N-acetylated-alpha-linked acidic dipeptidase